jgi:F-type H+-transporting ATPase subunit delta
MLRIHLPELLQALYASKPVAQVNVPSTSGDFGILPHHVPLITILKPGVVSVFENPDSSKKFFGWNQLLNYSEM